MTYPHESSSHPTADSGANNLANSIEFIIGINSNTFSIDNPNIHFYVKLKNKKYSECVWISRKSLEDIPAYSTQLLGPFKMALRTSKLSPVSFVRGLFKPDDIIFKESFFIPSRILSHRTENDKTYFFVQWKDLPVIQATWEDKNIPEEIIFKYKQSLENPNPVEYQSTTQFQEPDRFIPIENNVVYKNKNRLTEYQLDGLNWLLDKWHYNNNSILADESGVGKTVQSITFIEAINNITGYHGPYLIVAPLICVNKWEDEIEKWTNLRVLNFTGDEEQLKILNQYCIFTDNNRNYMKCDVVITSFETLKDHWSDLNGIEWLCLIADEIILKLKTNARIVKLLSQFSFDHMILLTKVDVLKLRTESAFTIFNLLEQDTFPQLEDFRNEYEKSDGSIDFNKLNDGENRKYVLRRTAEVLDPLRNNNQEEVIIEVEPSEFQHDQFKSYFLDNRDHFLCKFGLAHHLFQLRKISNHPFLVPNLWKEELDSLEKSLGSKPTPQHEVNLIIKSSGKMMVLDKLINRLRNANRRVLIFSQMTDMVSLLEVYLQKKGIPYERLDNAGSGQPRLYNKLPFVLLSSISKFTVDNTNADVAIIYDSHYTPPMKKRAIYRLFTRGTVEEDLFIRFSVEKNLSTALESDLDMLIRRNAHFAFHGDIDQSFASESLEKTLEYRTNPDFFYPGQIDLPDFWKDLFTSQDSFHVDTIDMPKNVLSNIADSMIDYGCYEARKHIPKHAHLDFLIASLLYALYKCLDKPTQKLLKIYMKKIKTLSKGITITKAVLRREPLSSILFVKELFHNDIAGSMAKISSNDRFYTALSFMCTPTFNNIGFVFGQSMTMPMYWNEHYDYTLIYTCCKNKMSETDNEIFIKELMDANLSSHDHVLTVNELKERVSLVISELELFIPEDFFPSVLPLKPIKWFDFYHPNCNIRFDTKINILRAVRALYLYGFPINIVNQDVLWSKLQKLMHLTPTPKEIIIAMVYSIIEAASQFMPVLLKLLKGIKPIRSIDVSWINQEVLIALANQLILFDRLRNIVRDISNRKSTFFISPWTCAPSWWKTKFDYIHMKIVAKEGFASLCLLKGLPHFRLTTEDLEKIEVEYKKENDMINFTLPDCLRDLSFLERLSVRVNRIKELVRIFDNPNFSFYIEKLPVNQNCGISIVQIGEKNYNGIPIGYYAIRFYKDFVNNEILSFGCTVVYDENQRHLFAIRCMNEGKNVNITALSVGQAYKMLLESLSQQSLALPPVYFNGYDFFGFKQAERVYAALS